MSDVTIKRCSVSGGDLPEGFKAEIDVSIDFDGATPADERAWAMSHLIISVQRVLKKKTTKELNELSKTGYTVRALDAGKQATDPKAAYKAWFRSLSKEEQIEELERLQAE